MSTSETVGDRLARARKAVDGLDASHLSDLAGLGSSAHVGMIERGDVKEPRVATLKVIADTLGVPVEWLLLGGEEPDPDVIRAAVQRARDMKAAAAQTAEHT